MNTENAPQVEMVSDEMVLVRKDVLHLATVTLGHAYHTVLTGELAEDAHTSYQALDAVLDAAGYKSPDAEPYVSPMKAIADDLRNGTFRGVVK